MHHKSIPKRPRVIFHNDRGGDDMMVISKMSPQSMGERRSKNNERDMNDVHFLVNVRERALVHFFRKCHDERPFLFLKFKKTSQNEQKKA